MAGHAAEKSEELRKSGEFCDPGDTNHPWALEFQADCSANLRPESKGEFVFFG